MATEKPRRRGNVPAMVYALVGIPLIGAVMDGVRSVRGTGKLTGAGMTVPVLLVASAVVLAAGMFVAHQQRRKRMLSRMPMPEGQWEAVLQEAGWSFRPKPEDKALPSAPANAAGLTAEPFVTADTSTPCDGKNSVQTQERSAVPESVPASSAVTTADEIPTEVQAVASEQVISVETSVPVLQAESGTASEPKSEPATETVETSPVLLPVVKELVLVPWGELTTSRTGDRAIIFLQPKGFQALPLCSMTPDQASHLHRMILRKLRPSPDATAIRRRR